MCDNCRYYQWYYDWCTKWECEVDFRAVHNCIEPRDMKIKEAMVDSSQLYSTR